MHDAAGHHRLRNLRVAWALQSRGVATLILDLHTSGTLSARGEVAYDVEALGDRLVAAIDWARANVPAATLALGIVGASVGAAVTLRAASLRPADVHAIVSFSGRFDLAAQTPRGVAAPTLLIVGADDEINLRTNQAVFASLPPGSSLIAIPRGGFLFAEPAVLEHVVDLATSWLAAQLAERVRGGEAGAQRLQRAAE